MKTIYTGAFLLQNLPGTLNNIVENQHVTFVPPGVPKNLSIIGEHHTFKVIGYANDGHNEGYLVELPEGFKEHYHNQNPPHITLSLADGARAVNTGKLNFEQLAEPFNVEMRFGEFTNQGIIFEK